MSLPTFSRSQYLFSLLLQMLAATDPELSPFPGIVPGIKESLTLVNLSLEVSHISELVAFDIQSLVHLPQIGNP